MRFRVVEQNDPRRFEWLCNCGTFYDMKTGNRALTGKNILFPLIELRCPKCGLGNKGNVKVIDHYKKTIYNIKTKEYEVKGK